MKRAKRLPIFYSSAVRNTDLSKARYSKICSNPIQKAHRDEVDYFNLIHSLQRNAELNSLELGKTSHALLIQTGFANGVFVANHLVNMYANCGEVDTARQVFDKMHRRNLFSWNIMIGGYVKNGLGEKPIYLYKQMGLEGIRADGFTLSAVLVACSKISGLEQGRQIHCCVIRDGFESDLVICTSILDMYSKGGEIDDARRIFDEIRSPNLVSWGCMIVGYGQMGHEEHVIQLFLQFISSGFSPDRVLLSCSLRSCGNLPADDLGLQIHTLAIKIGLESDKIVGSALVRTYTKLGNLDSARQVFDKIPQLDLVLWSSMIVGCAQNRYEKEALKLFKTMRAQGLPADQFVFSSILSACASLSALDHGKSIQAQTVKMGFDQDENVASATINMNSRCGNLVDSVNDFSLFAEPDITMFNSLLTGYTQNGCAEEALKLMKQIQIVGLVPDQFTFSSVLASCSSLAALDPGKQNHAFAHKTGFGLDLTVQSGLIGMYAKSGCLQEAHQIFKHLKERNLVSWNTIISAFAEHGQANEALRLFDQMKKQDGLKPDSITYLSLLSACRHAGFIDEGLKLLNSMNEEDTSLIPGLEHYCCLIDLFSRAGRLDEAMHMIKSMPVEPDSAVWGALLSGCRTHSNIELGELATEKLLESETENAGGYILLSNIYAVHGRWSDTSKFRKIMKELNTRKVPGCSWIEITGKTHVFFSSDLLHPRRIEIMALLEFLTVHIKEAGKVYEEQSNQ